MKTLNVIIIAIACLITRSNAVENSLFTGLWKVSSSGQNNCCYLKSNVTISYSSTSQAFGVNALYVTSSACSSLGLTSLQGTSGTISHSTTASGTNIASGGITVGGVVNAISFDLYEGGETISVTQKPAIFSSTSTSDLCTSTLTKVSSSAPKVIVGMSVLIASVMSFFV